MAGCDIIAGHWPRRGAMRLSPEQLREFDEQGYLFLPDCFGEEEVAALRRDAEAIYRSDRPEVWKEKSGAPRTAFAAHTYNEGFRLLGAHPRLIQPGEQLLDRRNEARMRQQ